MSETTAARRGLPTRVKMRHDQHFVEELASRDAEETIGRMLRLASIEADPAQPRSSMGDIEELAESIRSKGVLEPILVREIGEDSRERTRYRIISGERRFRASGEAGLVDVPAIVMDVDEDEALEIALVENLQRKDLTPFEEAEGYKALADLHGYTQEQISDAVGKSRTVITECLQLLQMSQKVRQAVEALGVKSKSTLLGIVKAAQTEEEQIELLERVAQHGMSRDDLREKAKARARRKSGGRPKAPVFTFRDPDKTFSLSVRFRRSTVEKTDLIAALEKILQELREEE